MQRKGIVVLTRGVGVGVGVEREFEVEVMSKRDYT